MTPERWRSTCAYLNEVFGREDDHLADLTRRASAEGLPSIAVSADVGRLLGLLTSMASDGRGALLALELGTLAGYSGTWIARALAPGGKLITVEPVEEHAEFARRGFERAGLEGRVEIVRAPALEALPVLARRFGRESFDLMFFDAIKSEYLRYFALAEPLLRPGGLLIADNTLGGGDWWIDAVSGTNASRDTVDRFNRHLAEHPGFASACVPIREGVLIARKLGSSDPKGGNQ